MQSTAYSHGASAISFGEVCLSPVLTSSSCSSTGSFGTNWTKRCAFSPMASVKLGWLIQCFEFLFHRYIFCLAVHWLSWIDPASRDQFVAWSGRKDLCSRGFDWRTFNVDIIFSRKLQWRIANLLNVGFLILSLSPYHFLIPFLSRSWHSM